VPAPLVGPRAALASEDALSRGRADARLFERSTGAEGAARAAPWAAAPTPPAAFAPAARAAGAAARRAAAAAAALLAGASELRAPAASAGAPVVELAVRGAAAPSGLALEPEGAASRAAGGPAGVATARPAAPAAVQRGAHRAVLARGARLATLALRKPPLWPAAAGGEGARGALEGLPRPASEPAGARRLNAMFADGERAAPCGVGAGAAPRAARRAPPAPGSPARALFHAREALMRLFGLAFRAGETSVHMLNSPDGAAGPGQRRADAHPRRARGAGAARRPALPRLVLRPRRGRPALPGRRRAPRRATTSASSSRRRAG
jgi:hypothetical protein